jgi:hypothetical protein
MVGMLAKERLRGIKSRDADPFDSDRGALFHQIQNASSHSRSTSSIGLIATEPEIEAIIHHLA